jgi:transcriptional regulator with XRE-family HTH domain
MNASAALRPHGILVGGMKASKKRPQPASRKGNTAADWAKQIRALRAELGIGQRQFAEKLGVERQATISDWECGRGSKPSANLYVKMSQLAKSRAGRAWFWRQAGLGLAAVKQMLPEVRAQLKESRAGLAETIPLVDLPHVHDSTPTEEAVKQRLPLPADFVRDPGHAVAIEVPDDHLAPLFSSGDVLVLDRSELDLGNFEDGQLVAAEWTADFSSIDPGLRHQVETIKRKQPDLSEQKIFTQLLETPPAGLLVGVLKLDSYSAMLELPGRQSSRRVLIGLREGSASSFSMQWGWRTLGRVIALLRAPKG